MSVISKFGSAEVTSLNNVLYEMIFKRKSFHIFRDVGNESISKDELNDIQSAYSEFTPLDPGIKTAIHIVPEKETNCKRGGEYCILLYSEKKDGYLQNIGYLGEQLDLYLVSRNIGTLWFGIGKTQEKPFEDMEFVRIWNSSLCFLSVKSVMALNTVRICLGAKERALRKYGKAIRSRV